jgi:hypothetical protein
MGIISGGEGEEVSAYPGEVDTGSPICANVQAQPPGFLNPVTHMLKMRCSQPPCMNVLVMIGHQSFGSSPRGLRGRRVGIAQRHQRVFERDLVERGRRQAPQPQKDERVDEGSARR